MIQICRLYKKYVANSLPLEKKNSARCLLRTEWLMKRSQSKAQIRNIQRYEALIMDVQVFHKCIIYVIIIVTLIMVLKQHNQQSIPTTSINSWIINCSVKSSSNNISNENINTHVSVVFKTKRKLKCQNKVFLKYDFSENTSFYVFITEII